MPCISCACGNKSEQLGLLLCYCTLVHNILETEKKKKRERERERERGREGGREGSLVPRLLPFNETHVGRVWQIDQEGGREGGRERERERPHYPILPLQKMTFLSRSRCMLRLTRLSLVPFTRRCLVAHTSPVEGDGNGNNTPKPPPLNPPPPPPRWSKRKQHPQTPPPDGGNGNNTPWWNYLHFVPAALVVALGVGCTFFRDGIYECLNVQKVMKAIIVSKLRMPRVAGYIERNQEMKAFKRKLYNSEDLKTIVVTGPRGSGKSTLVKYCLAGKGGVVRIVLNTQSSFSEEKFAENVMDTIGVSYAQSGTNVKALLSLSLRRLRKSQEELPIFVIEADERCTPGQLRSLLILMKHYGADEGLIRPIVVLSSSTSAFGLNIGLMELRSRCFHVDDLTDEQCLEYLESRLSSMIEGDEQEISNFVKDVVPHLGIGNRLIHLLVGMSKLKLDMVQHKLDKVQEHIESYVEERVRIYTSSVISFFEEVKGTCHSKKAVKRAFKLLLEKGNMPFYTFREVCGVEEERFIEIISNIHPNPFYVNPLHRTIHFHAIFQHKFNFDILFDSVCYNGTYNNVCTQVHHCVRTRWEGPVGIRWWRVT